ncbi:SNF2-related protein [Cytobacillus horneckiae]|uniref:SNF2-related protein n=1 Tax=Cytobacillus horneckiae TaxID=549687 RepID=UPI0039A30543
MEKNPTSKEAVDFLKKEYGIGGWGGPNWPSVMYDSSGITVTSKNPLLNPGVERKIKWKDAASRIQELIKHNRYLTEEEKKGRLVTQDTVEKKEEAHKDSRSVESLKNQVSEDSSVKGQPNLVIPTKNYQYDPSDNLYPSGEKTKYQNNVAAIRLLKQLEANKNVATPSQQKILAKYVGWGGLANVFNPDSDKWSKEYKELKVLLSEKEYQDAMESTITAYYTDPAIIERVYKAIQNFGFKNGSILDPAMGTGNFFSVLPKGISESKLYGVELDSITGRIAKQLYPEANVQVQGYETTKFTDNQFDIVVGNIPFNNIKVQDERYDSHKFLIHDYFIAKSIDVVKPGGILAVITSRGTMDKKSELTRGYIAERSEFLGAIRLPNNAFKSIAGTEVTTDILFLKKREAPINIKGVELEFDWLNVVPIEGRRGIEINKYFQQHPEMVLGKMEYANHYGGTSEYKCVPIPGQELLPVLDKAISRIQGEFTAKQEKAEIISQENENRVQDSLEAPPGTKNFTYLVKDGKLFYCENNILIPQSLNKKDTERIVGLCGVRTALQEVIMVQAAPYDESELNALQSTLNKKYDDFVKKFGYINERSNQRAFFEDDQLPLLLSLEEEIDSKSYKKAAIFHKATIRPQVVRTHAQSAQEALEMSLNRDMKVDLYYMAELTGKEPEDLIKELGNKIYLNPEKLTDDLNSGWESSDEYLTGNVLDKLEYAKLMAKSYPELFSRNVQALEDNQPIPLLPGDIHFRIGSPWIPVEYYQEFMYEQFSTSEFNRISRYGIKIEFLAATNTWRINGKDREYKSIVANSVYGTKRRNAYQIFEDCLNLQDATVRDPERYTDRNGNEQTKYVVNPKETMIARSKQQEIQQGFKDWLFKDEKRSNHLLKIYNEKFNKILPRKYNGENLTFPNMNEEMQLRKHQKDAVARVISTGRGLLAHEVGAGKTAAMIASGMKLKQIGAIEKPMFVVMNHTIDQWAKEIMRFYPGANVLITTKKDFEKQNRRKFVSKIATGSYDAIVIGHSQFEKIPISKERQEKSLRKEISTLTYEIKQAKKEEGKDWSVKQLVIFQKSLGNKLVKLQNDPYKDEVINFEDLGVDCLFVDEAHVYKSLHTVTKLTNVAGIGKSSSLRASDMKMKCEYIQEVNQGRGVIFATGTPITNSMSEFYVMQRFLQPDILNSTGLEFFDKWAGTFGEVVSSLEMTPEGSGYRMKSRFEKFHNLPELMGMFNMVADIQTAEMLKLPVPDLETGKAQIIVSECSPYQQEMMQSFMERSEMIREGLVDPSEDNMLKLTHEAKLMAIDPRLINEGAPINETSKLNKCIDNVFKIWDNTKENRSTQMIFCDSGTPKPNEFNVYDEVKNQLIKKGIPSEEIAFIHDAKTDVQRDKLFAKMRNGDIRVLLGSTSKVGTGTNVQDKLIAGHHIDCPWRPADLTQRDGRILRQGNSNKQVSIFRYVTKGTFDAYLWQIQEQKLRYISQVMTGENISRSCDDTEETVLTAAEVKAIATDNPLLLEKMTLDNDVSRLRMIHNRWLNEKAVMEKNISIVYPKRVVEYENFILGLESDISTVLRNPGNFEIELEGMTYYDEKEAGQAIKPIISSKKGLEDAPVSIGSFKGLEVFVRKTVFNEHYIGLKGESQYDVPLRSHHDRSNIQRLTNIIEDYPQKINEYKEKIEETKAQLNHVENELTKTFPHEQELKELIKKQNELNLKMEFEEKIREKNNAQKVSDASQKVPAEVIINIPSDKQENKVKNTALIPERT